MLSQTLPSAATGRREATLAYRTTSSSTRSSFPPNLFPAYPVRSFVSQFSSGTKSPPTPAASPTTTSPIASPSANDHFPDHRIGLNPPPTPPSYPEHGTVEGSTTPDSPPHKRQRSNSRPLSINAYQPPLMDITEDTIPELQPVFSFLNSHSNKLYQEGYFLKLDDQNTQGKPNADRTWTECFAQLVGTVLSLWDAAELDAAGEDGEVLPKFINLTDASIKMIESLPTRSKDEQPLQNILSISTAGRNRYLLHFNSHHSLVQWTAGIRLAMYEHSTLQEAYTGALIAGKGKTLNNINVILERARLPTESWVRVRFGAGVPWRRCWCVISPPDEKEYAKHQKELKKRSAYDRSAVPALKGDIKFYDQRKEGKKQKKLQPIASINDAYAAYAIYPQAKSLVDASTLMKIEGNVSIHTDPPSSTEGFVFVMPELHPMVTGFEMLLRNLFPTWDTFGLYGRPGRLVASVLDQRSLMFAMPKHKRYGYLEILDVASLINEQGSSSWSEREWRKRLKEITGTRMNAIEEGGPRTGRNSASSPMGGARARVGFADDQVSARSSRSFSLNGGQRTDSAPPDGQGNLQQPSPDPTGRLYQGGQGGPSGLMPNRPYPQEFASPDDGRPITPQMMRNMNTPEPVSRPPAFSHSPQDRNVNKAYHSPEMRRANSRLSSTTLAQMQEARNNSFNELNGQPMQGGNGPPPPLHGQGMGGPGPQLRQGNAPLALNVPNNQNRSRSPYGPPSPGLGPGGRPLTAEGRRSPYPPAQGGVAGNHRSAALDLVHQRAVALLAYKELVAGVEDTHVCGAAVLVVGAVKVIATTARRAPSRCVVAVDAVACHASIQAEALSFRGLGAAAERQIGETTNTRACFGRGSGVNGIDKGA
ncbi:hypothetical protein NQ176_g4709 [Zarea fungicola]|uniref:Uncharacterized protein n=1 Tax=Zarea fungicola TaxID=93591 RepID=A0ACC1NC39_9HYPO|nr:hypothetical protein NQ176_g4709 [Lecanicillium fungicola]